jgi:hypothetical protein
MHTILDKHDNIKTDLFRFVAISLIITFFIDVTLTKIAQISLVSTIAESMPGVSDFFKEILLPTSNATVTYLHPLHLVQFGSIKTAVTLIPGQVPIGTLLFFILRQLRYKAKKNDISNYPGGTILLLFVLAVAIVLGFDIFLIIQGKAPLWVLCPANPNMACIYGLKQFTDFSLTYLINPVYYVATASAWIFDWYLFSKIWSKEIPANEQLKRIK